MNQLTDTEAQLRLFKRVVDGSTDAIGLSTPAGRHWYQNAAFDRLFGDIGEDPPASLYVDEAVGREVFQTIMRGEEWSGEVQMYGADGRVLDILLRAYAFVSEADEILGLVGVHTDITERRRVQERLTLVARSMNDVFYEWDLAADGLRWFSDVGEHLGYPSGSIASTIEAWMALVHPDDAPRVAEAVERHRSSTRNIDYTYRVRHADGAWRYCHDLATPVLDHRGRPTRWVGGIRDVTEQKQTEEALRRREEQYRLLIEHHNDLVVEVDADGTFRFVSPSYCETFGKSEGELLGQRFMPLVHEDDRAPTARAMEQLLVPPHTAYMEQRAMTKRGWRWLAWSDRAIVGEGGAIESIVGVGRDITEQKRTEEALEREKERLAVTLRSIGDAVITTDRAGRVVLINPIAEALTGWKEADAVGQPLSEVFRIEDEETGRPLESPVERVLDSGQVVGLANHTVLVSMGGQRYRIADSGAPIRGDDGEILGVVLVFRDITAQERLERELQRVEKLESIGVLAGGIAHDFNNFLTGIIGNLSLARLDVEPGDPVLPPLEEVEKAAMHARALTQQLLTFSKGGAPVRRIVRIADLLRDSVRFALRGSNVKSRFDIEPGLLPAMVDESQIAQVIHNLAINAAHAMANGGTVVVRARNTSGAHAKPLALPAGDVLELVIEDEGIGIPPEYLERIFDPYFTTKHKGSGLGLAVAYNIVSKHEGAITAQSRVGEGTRFTIYLPAARRADAVERPARREVVRGRGRILVMDDEDYIRKLASAVLSRLGYESVGAADGEAAVRLYRESLEAGRPYHGVILDLTVPGGMGGKETIARLLELDPDVRAIVSSGYSNDPVMAEHTRHGFRGAVQKPYEVQDLSEVLAAIVREAAD